MPKKKYKPNLLIIGDLHLTEKRERAINIAINSIYTYIPKDSKFDYAILLGDIFNKYPNEKERIMFANFLKELYNYTTTIITIKGTNSHDFSQGIYNLEDLLILNNNLQAETRFKLNNFLFVHEPIKGAKYDNGIEEKEGLNISIIKEKIIAGHYHQQQEKNNLIICGSIYKTTFAQKDDTKRILILNSNNEIQTISIQSRPMYEITLIGKKGKIICKELKELKRLPQNIEIDLKINAITDTETLPYIHNAIQKIKDKFNIEYYQEDIEIERLKINVPKNLNDEQLLKEYSKENYDLAIKELKK